MYLSTYIHGKDGTGLYITGEYHPETNTVAELSIMPYGGTVELTDILGSELIDDLFTKHNIDFQEMYYDKKKERA